MKKWKMHLIVLSCGVIMTAWLAVAAALTNLVGIHLNDFTGSLWYVANMTISLYVTEGVWIATQKIKNLIKNRR